MRSDQRSSWDSYASCCRKGLSTIFCIVQEIFANGFSQNVFFGAATTVWPRGRSIGSGKNRMQSLAQCLFVGDFVRRQIHCGRFIVALIRTYVTTFKEDSSLEIATYVHK